jgi:hypothetical protein
MALNKRDLFEYLVVNELLQKFPVILSNTNVYKDVFKLFRTAVVAQSTGKT